MFPWMELADLLRVKAFQSRGHKWRLLAMSWYKESIQLSVPMLKLLLFIVPVLHVVIPLLLEEITVKLQEVLLLFFFLKLVDVILIFLGLHCLTFMVAGYIKPARSWLPDDEVGKVKNMSFFCIIEAFDANNWVSGWDFFYNFVVTMVSCVLPWTYTVNFSSKDAFSCVVDFFSKVYLSILIFCLILRRCCKTWKCLKTLLWILSDADPF